MTLAQLEERLLAVEKDAQRIVALDQVAVRLEQVALQLERAIAELRPPSSTNNPTGDELIPEAEYDLVTNVPPLAESMFPVRFVQEDAVPIRLGLSEAEWAAAMTLLEVQDE